MHYNCLIIDDEIWLAESTSEYFNMFEVKTTFVTTSDACLEFLNNNSVDLFLLDINLKDESGFELCKILRDTYSSPILFISARTSTDDMLIALNIGGDDYITKPYTLSVLLAKVKAVLKRCRLNADDADSIEDKYVNGELEVDFKLGKVFAGKKEISLKAMEYKLLAYLIHNKGRVVPKEELFENVWENIITGDGTLNVHIRHIREKIEKDPNNPMRIKTIWGRGYIFEDI